MKLIEKLQNTKLCSFIQGKNRRSQATLDFLKACGYPMANIRGALLELHDLKPITEKLVNGHDFTAPLFYAVIAGRRHNAQVQSIVAKALGFEIVDLFPPES